MICAWFCFFLDSASKKLKKLCKLPALKNNHAVSHLPAFFTSLTHHHHHLHLHLILGVTHCICLLSKCLPVARPLLNRKFYVKRKGINSSWLKSDCVHFHVGVSETLWSSRKQSYICLSFDAEELGKEVCLT